MSSPLVFRNGSHLSTNLLDWTRRGWTGLEKALVSEFSSCQKLRRTNGSTASGKDDNMIIIGWCKARRVRRMLKNLPFELLESGFDDLCSMTWRLVWPDLALS